MNHEQLPAINEQDINQQVEHLGDLISGFSSKVAAAGLPEQSTYVFDASNPLADDTRLRVKSDENGQTRMALYDVVYDGFAPISFGVKFFGVGRGLGGVPTLEVHEVDEKYSAKDPTKTHKVEGTRFNNPKDIAELTDVLEGAVDKIKARNDAYEQKQAARLAGEKKRNRLHKRLGRAITRRS